MSNYSVVQTLITAQVAGANLTASTTATSLLPGAAKYILPANTLSIGQSLRIKSQCTLGNIVTTPGTLTLDVRFNSTPIIVFNGGAMQLSSTAHTTLPLWVEILLTCRAIGSGTSANFMGQGIAISQCLSLTAVADSTTTPATLLMPNTVPTVGTGFDSTVSNVIDFFGTFSLNNANAIQLQQYTLELMN
jgi:hypothetical protein